MSHAPQYEVSFRASEFRRDQMESFVGVLQALGLDVSAEYSSTGRTVRVEVRDLPDRVDAERSRTRNAGRHSQGIRPPASSIFNCDTPCSEFLEWQESHTAAEGMEQLGLSRTTYFRRMRQIRARVEEADRVNAARDRSPKWDGGPRLAPRLGDVR